MPKTQKPNAGLALALRHREASQAAKAATARELELRGELVAELFPKLERGTHHHDFGGGYVLKVEVRPKVALETAQLSVALDVMREDGELGAELAGRLVKYKPELMLSEYQKLPTKFADLMKDAVTIGQSTPSVTLSVPD